MTPHSRPPRRPPSGDPYRDGNCLELTNPLPLMAQLEHCHACSGLAPAGKCWIVSMRVAQALSGTRGKAKGDMTPFAPLGSTTKTLVTRALSHLGRL